MSSSSPPNPWRCTCPPGDCAGDLAAWSGDDDAARRLDQRLDSQIRRIIGRRVEPRDPSFEDIQQEVWLRIYARRRTYRGDQPFCHWASVVARHEVLLWLRRARTRLDPPSPRLDGADDEASRAEWIEEVRAASLSVLRSWSPGDRSVIEASLDGLNGRQIAARLDVSYSMVNRLLGRFQDEVRLELIRREVC